MGALIPKKIKEYYPYKSKIFKDNSSFVFFYDDNKLRKCAQRNNDAAFCDKWNEEFILAVGTKY